MEPALKQRLIGAAVLVALAVIFLPMLVQGPAPESGAADVPLEMPAVPSGDFETRELPLVTPSAAPQGGAVGLDIGAPDGELPTVDTSDVAADLASEPAKPDEMFPPATAGGDYAVDFGAYAAAASADVMVNQLRVAQLPGYRERISLDGKTAYRVWIGPYASRAKAEAARLRAADVRDDINARVVVLDADASTDKPANDEPAAVAATRPDKPAPASKPVADKPVPAATPAPAAPAPATPAATDTGFVVQLGAFRDTKDALGLRDRVRDLGFTVFTQQVRSEQGLLTRVMVGPVLDRASAEALQQQLQAKVKIDGLVRSHP